MKNFTYAIPTVIHFGKGQIEKLGAEIAQRSRKVLVVYGGGSVKRNGIYDAALAQLKAHGVEWAELSGVEPNPRIATVREGVRLCREQGLDGVLALGGGSVIDCSKGVAAGALYDGDPWDFPAGKAVPEKALPLFTVLTMAATGSEMDSIAVISNPETNEKEAFAGSCCYPAVSILDPTYTYSLPAAQTAAGTADIMSHTFENYFSPIETNYLADSLAEAILRSCVKYGPKAMETPDDYEARANLMWNASWAINGFLDMGKPVAWSVHRMEHELSAFYDVTHGVGLAILTPNWMRYVLSDKTEARFARYGAAVWGLDPALPAREAAEAAIRKTREFFSSLGLPATLAELGIGPEHFEEMARKARNSGFDKTFVPLSVEDIVSIYRMSL
ncbi:MAG: iron-containing alcohol dehydrogenase [Oscillibacter sp.]|nr:iron-containing alcohol dehydrogenase [uncultured Oscillibacter sp.]MCI8971437.1 iron-containing alcohol dehydrogenase [Oscillibacter sp.]